MADDPNADIHEYLRAMVFDIARDQVRELLAQQQAHRLLLDVLFAALFRCAPIAEREVLVEQLRRRDAFKVHGDPADAAAIEKRMRTVLAAFADRLEVGQAMADTPPARRH